ncbi:ATP-binding protein [candidate division KSB1 bacterium]|nr:ATP-binding protein [candidate division KSB1 bacterium]
MYIPQYHIQNIEKFLVPNKVLLLYGARRVGKTTLIQKFIENYSKNAQNESGKVLFVNGDDIYVRQYLESQSIQKLREFVGNHALLVIDEAQYIRQIGLNLKLIVDHIPNVKVIATGSSSFELASDIGEPLTGRKYILRLFPIAQLELLQIEKPHEIKANLESRLIFGAYPEIVTLMDNRMREEYLREMLSSYLFKDILELEGVRHADKLVRLLQLIAFQIGKEISLNELGTQLGMSKNTVERYLDLLEKVFIIFKRAGFSRNLRKEISKNHRFYFCDNGIRNALIRNFNPLALRNDAGELWENYVVIERLKKQEYLRHISDSYFWRTYNKQEIDLVEERDGKLSGYEIKYQPVQTKPPSQWLAQYPEASFEVIHSEKYLDFIC